MGRLRQLVAAGGHGLVRARLLAAVVLGLAFLLWLILLAPKLLIPARSDGSLADVTDSAKRHELEDGRLKLQNDVRTSLLQALGGSVVALGAFFTYRQLQVNREGQITERFTRAIDQLGNDKGQLDVTLGGIYALERIAKDSQADRATIAEVLTAYARGHAPWPPTRSGQYIKDAPLDQLPSLQERSPDVQAVLTVLGRMPPGDRHSPQLRTPDVQWADLSAADMEREGYIPTAHMPSGDRHLPNLRSTDLRRADLTFAHLEGAYLSGAHLEGASLLGAHLKGASLLGAHLEGAHLSGAHLEGAHLSGANLQGAYVFDAHLEGARADQTTKWPDGLDLEAAGIVNLVRI